MGCKVECGGRWKVVEGGEGVEGGMWWKVEGCGGWNVECGVRWKLVEGRRYWQVDGGGRWRKVGGGGRWKVAEGGWKVEGETVLEGRRW